MNVFVSWFLSQPDCFGIKKLIFVCWFFIWLRCLKCLSYPSSFLVKSIGYFKYNRIIPSYGGWMDAPSLALEEIVSIFPRLVWYWLQFYCIYLSMCSDMFMLITSWLFSWWNLEFCQTFSASIEIVMWFLSFILLMCDVLQLLVCIC
jgi:hypothetical protein